MNKHYWKNFYKSEHENTPSSFAMEINERIPKNSRIIDLGCGNGRDSRFFAKHNHFVYGIDYAIKNHFETNLNLKNYDIDKIYTINMDFDVIYSRFFLHAIHNYQITKILKWSKGLFCAECRTQGDEPEIYKNHDRNFINGNWLLKAMIKNGFEIIDFKISKGLAKYKDEDPLVLRVIAYK